MANSTTIKFYMDDFIDFSLKAAVALTTYSIICAGLLFMIIQNPTEVSEAKIKLMEHLLRFFMSLQLLTLFYYLCKHQKVFSDNKSDLKSFKNWFYSFFITVVFFVFASIIITTLYSLSSSLI